MKLILKFDFQFLAQKLLEEKLDQLGIKYNMPVFGEIILLESVSDTILAQIHQIFTDFGIEIIENQKNILVQKIKDAIYDMLHSEDVITIKFSIYLAQKLNHSYGYLSNLFSEVTYTSIENFIIIQKIELAKNHIINAQLTLTEIAYKLNYSSVAHLSAQFKNVTGITPSAFQRIIEKRREFVKNNNL